MSKQPNVLYIMTDQQRFDTIAALGNAGIHTPNLDRLVARGVSLTRAYSTCPVCVPARYTIQTGREPYTTGVFQNGAPSLAPGQAPEMEARCGPYLARTMQGLGYRTFGIGKFHTSPWDADIGYDVHLHSEELYGTPDQRARDAYAAYIAREHPEYDFIEGLMGERTDMYYMPQMRPMPAHVTQEAWAARNAVEQIARGDDERPFFGFVSVITPHPPIAPPIPFNRMYHPDRMPGCVLGDLAVDHLDEQIPWMNYMIWAEDISAAQARVIRARYYASISHIDYWLGKILDAVEARPDAANTLIAFFSDHGDHLGDHHAWQKESFFDVSCRVPLLVSWPAELPAGQVRTELACLTDLFGLATAAAGAFDPRDGTHLLGMLRGTTDARRQVVGLYGEPGSPLFKIMVRVDEWKYIFCANGGRELLFAPESDPGEVVLRNADAPEALERMRALAVLALSRPNADRALDGGALRVFPFAARPLTRIQQFDQSRGVFGYPEHPADVLVGFDVDGGGVAS